MSSSLFSEVDTAYNLGDHVRGLHLLRELSQAYPKDPQVLFRYAMAEEERGDLPSAGQLYLKLIKLAPHHPVPYLYAGYTFERLQQADLAASCYSLADDVDGTALKLHQGNGVSRDIALRSSCAKQFLCRYFRQQHQRLSTHSPQSIANACWVQLWDQPIDFQQPLQRPHFFYIPALKPQPVFDLNATPWSQKLCGATNLLVQELNNYLLHRRGEVVPYLDKSHASNTSFKPLAGSTNWGAIHLYQDGKLNQDTARYFPETLKALLTAPLYGLDQHPFEVFFSLLKPGQSIPPHYGLSNHSLTVHLPLILSPQAYLEVAQRRYPWRLGELLAFDDSFIHAAVNHGQQERVVLIFSIWNPGLDQSERAAIQQLFLQRKIWLEQRNQHIQAALNHS